MTRTPKSKSWRDILPVHPAAALFRRANPDELRELGEDIKARGLTSPIVLWRESPEAPLQLVDGVSRLDGIELCIGRIISIRPLLLAGNRMIPRCDNVVELDSTVDPYAYGKSANVLRRHLTGEQKRELIENLLKADPDQSDRAIARAVKADNKTVAATRKGMEGREEIPHVARRKDKNGRRQPATKYKPPKSPLGQQIKQDAKAMAAARARESAATESQGARAHPDHDDDHDRDRRHGGDRLRRGNRGGQHHGAGHAASQPTDAQGTDQPKTNGGIVPDTAGTPADAATVDSVEISKTWRDEDWTRALKALEAERYRRIHRAVEAALRPAEPVQADNRPPRTVH
jgi:hypothetical protein